MSVASDSLTSFIHESDIDCTVCSCLDINYMGIRVICSSENLSGVGGHLEVELVKNGLTLIDLAKFLL